MFAWDIWCIGPFPLEGIRGRGPGVVDNGEGVIEGMGQIDNPLEGGVRCLYIFGDRPQEFLQCCQC